MLTTEVPKSETFMCCLSLGSGILDRVGNTPLIRIDGLDDRSREVEF